MKHLFEKHQKLAPRFQLVPVSSDFYHIFLDSQGVPAYYFDLGKENIWVAKICYETDEFHHVRYFVCFSLDHMKMAHDCFLEGENRSIEWFWGDGSHVPNPQATEWLSGDMILKRSRLKG